MALLKIEKRIDDILVIRLEDNISIENATKFEKEAFDFLRDKNFKIILEIKEVNYIISQAFGTLVHWHKKNNDNGGFLALLKVGDKVGRIISILKLDKIIYIGDSIEEVRSHYEI